MKAQRLGSYCLTRVRSPHHSGYNPYWQVRLSLRGQRVRVESANKTVPERCRICDECLAVPAELSPGRTRAKCECQSGVRRFYDGYLERMSKVHGELVRRGRFDKVDELLVEREAMCFGEIVPLIESKGPKGSRGKNVHALRNLVEGRFGVSLELVRIEDLTWRRVIEWARMYQEYGRRGWTARAAVQPAIDDEQSVDRGEVARERWAVLRGLLESGSLPELDTETLAPWNTTIRTVVRMVKAVLGAKARSVMLLDVADRLPRLPWVEPKQGVLALPAPKGRQFKREGYQAFWDELPKLRAGNPRLWLYLRLLTKLGARSKEPLSVREHWLEQDADGKVILVLKNRPEENFRLKAGTRAIERHLELEPDVVEVIEKVMCETWMPAVRGKGWRRGLRKGAGGAELSADRQVPVSVLGCRTRRDGEDLYREASAWMRRFVPEGSATLYLLRHNAITQRAMHEGAEAAAAAAGHAMGSSVTLNTYVEPRGVIAPLCDTVLMPEGVFSRPRNAWRPRDGGRLTVDA